MPILNLEIKSFALLNLSKLEPLGIFECVCLSVKTRKLGAASGVQRLQLLAATVLAIAAAVVGRARLTQLVEAVLLLLVRGEVAAHELVVVGGGGVALLVALRHARPAHLRVRQARLLRLDLLAG